MPSANAKSSRKAIVADLSLIVKEQQLEPELILPIQYTQYDGVRATGERRLMYELLAGALHDLTSPIEEVAQAAKLWLMDGTSGYISAEDACEWLNISYPNVKTKVAEGLKLKRTRCSGALEPVLGHHDPLERAGRLDRRFATPQLLLFVE